MTKPPPLGQVQWRKSTFSNGGDGGDNCVEVGALPDGGIAVRDSSDPSAGFVYLTRAEMDAWIKGVKAGEFDDLA